MAERVAGRSDSGQPRNDFLVPIVLRDLAVQGIEDPAVRFEQTLHAAFGSAAHFALIHPEFPFDGGDHHLGIGEGELLLRIEQAGHVVVVKMRDDHDVDILPIDAGGFHVRARKAAGGAGFRTRRLAVTCVDQYELRAGIDNERRERNRDLRRIFRVRSFTREEPNVAVRVFVSSGVVVLKK